MATRSTLEFISAFFALYTVASFICTFFVRGVGDEPERLWFYKISGYGFGLIPFLILMPVVFENKWNEFLGNVGVISAISGGFGGLFLFIFYFYGLVCGFALWACPVILIVRLFNKNFPNS